MIFSIAAILASAGITDDSCPHFRLEELRPERGEVFTYDTWRDEVTQPGRVRFEIERSEPGIIRAGMSVFAAGEWTPPFPRRLVGGLVIHTEEMFNGIDGRQVVVRGLDDEVLARRLGVDDELRIPVVETATQPSGEVARHAGEYIFRHTGCGQLVRDGETVQTRQINVRLSRFVGDREAGWQLATQSYTYDVPVGATFWYSHSNDGNNPMQQGTLMEGYTVP